MRIVAVTGNVVTVAATREELSLLVATARMALDVVTVDPAAPKAARDRLASVLRDYDTAVARAPAPREPTHTERTEPMHVKIVNFNLVDMTEGGYSEACDQFAPAFAELPGLLAKIWLRDPSSNTYGGVYLFVDRAAGDAYAASDLFRSVEAFPHFTNISVRDFSVDEETTRRTQQGIEVLAGLGTTVG
jgi:Putative mono-oxygenase ydhR